MFETCVRPEIKASEDYFQTILKKMAGDSAIWDNSDNPRGCSVQRSSLSTEGSVLHRLIYMSNLT